MHWSTPLKIVTAAAMLAAGIWLAGIDHEDTPRTAAPVPQTAAPAPTASLPAPVTPSTACEALKNMIVPVQGVQREELSDTYNDARSEGRRHDAIDIMAPRGTPVIAAAAGRVEKLFLSDAGGTTAYIRSRDGHLVYYYAHLDRYAPSLKEGQALSRGARIGAVGFTGNADPAAPHLHFAVMATAPQSKWWEDAAALNPYQVLAKRAVGGGMGCGR